MVEESIRKIILDYIETVQKAGIPVAYALLFGSYAREEDSRDSDIDILIVSPEFDRPDAEQKINLLWELRVKTDSRIEPLPIGLKAWESGDVGIVGEKTQEDGIVFKQRA